MALDKVKKRSFEIENKEDNWPSYILIIILAIIAVLIWAFSTDNLAVFYSVAFSVIILVTVGPFLIIVGAILLSPIISLFRKRDD